MRKMVKVGTVRQKCCTNTYQYIGIDYIYNFFRKYLARERSCNQIQKPKYLNHSLLSLSKNFLPATNTYKAAPTFLNPLSQLM